MVRETVAVIRRYHSQRALLSLILLALVAYITVPTRVIATTSEAYFTSVLATDGNGSSQVLGGGTAKVYANQGPVWENTTFYNNITTSPSSLFYEVIFVTSGINTVSFTGTQVLVNQGSSGSFNWEMPGGFGAAGVVQIAIQLWLNTTIAPIIEDTAQFNFFVVSLTVVGWTQSQVSVQRGLNIQTHLDFNFTNSGNDVMYNASLALMNSSGLQIQPFTVLLGNIGPSQTVGTHFMVSASGDAILGAHSATLSLYFFDFRSEPHQVTETSVIMVMRLGTQLRMDVNPASIKESDYSLIHVQLLDNNGNPVDDAPVNVTLGNFDQILLRTDSYGNAVYQYHADIGSGVYLLSSEYSGTDLFASSSAVTLLSVGSLGTSLTLTTPTTAKIGDTLIFAATLLDEIGQPVEGGNVTFLVNGVVAGWVITDGTGAAVFYYFARANGVIHVKATFSGTDVYEGSDTSISDISVVPASLIVLGGIDLTLPLMLLTASVVVVLTLRSLNVKRKDDSLVASREE